MRRKILAIYTGGTIGMKMSKAGVLEPVDFDQLLKEIPELHQLDSEISSLSFEEPLDSSNITPEIWSNLVNIIELNYEDYDGFVIIHGTDTMSFTASALSYMIQNTKKPIILTGSQLPISSIRTDGRENLITAIEIAAAHENGVSIVQEVAIYFSSYLYRGNRSIKVDADMFKAFTTFNYPELAKAGTEISYNHSALLRTKSEVKFYPDMCSDIIIVTLFPGLKKEIVEALFNVKGVRGVVLRTFGAGNITSNGWIHNIISEAIKSGIVVVNVTQCEGGNVAMEKYSTGMEGSSIGLISGKDITVEAATTKLSHLLASYDDIEIIRDKMSRSIAGEISL